MIVAAKTGNVGRLRLHYFKNLCISCGLVRFVFSIFVLTDSEPGSWTSENEKLRRERGEENIKEKDEGKAKPSTSINQIGKVK